MTITTIITAIKLKYINYYNNKIIKIYYLFCHIIYKIDDDGIESEGKGLRQVAVGSI